jgi:hypothetical protein
MLVGASCVADAVGSATAVPEAPELVSDPAGADAPATAAADEVFV